MPIAPQITITPVDVPLYEFTISAVTYTSTTATYTATGHTFTTGDVVIVSDLAPSGYNGTFTITGTATNTFTVDNTTNKAVTDANGTVVGAPASDADYYDVNAVFTPSSDDLKDPNINPAIADAAIALANAVQAAADAQAATLAAGTAQTTANGKNTVHYSNSAPGSTANTVGDIWYQYGTSGANNGRIIAQYTGAGGTSWTQTTISGLVVANIDAGTITAGTITAAVGINNPSGTFAVDGATGKLTCSGADITGKVTATSGTFTGSVTSDTGSIGGWTLASGYLVSADANTYLNSGSSATNAMATTKNINVGSIAVNGASLGTNKLAVTGSASISSDLTISGAFLGYGSVTASGELYAAGHSTTSNTANGYVFSTGGRIARSTASSQRYKENIVDLVTVPELDPKKLLNLPVRAFSYKSDYLDPTDDRAGMLIPGFIAEEVDAIYPIAADYLEGPESWNDRLIVPALLALIQDLTKRVEELESRIS